MTRFDNFIGGEWTTSIAYSRNISPSDTDYLVGEFAQADAKQMHAAIGAARQAFPKWSQTTPQQRFDVLDQAGTTILARKQELGNLLAREEGKTLAEAVGEVTRAGQIFNFFASVYRLRLFGHAFCSSGGQLHQPFLTGFEG